MLVLGVAGCPGARRHTLVPDVPRSGDKNARARFQEARANFERDGVRDTARFQAIAEEYPDDPVAAYAHLYAGMAALENREYQIAVAEFEALGAESDVDNRVRARGLLLQGMAETHLGRYDDAEKHLLAGERALGSDDQEKQRYAACLAEALGHSAQPLRALVHYDLWYRGASGSERAYITARLEAIASAANPADAARAFRALGKSESAASAVLGWRVARDLRAGGDTAEARAVETAIARMRAAMGLATASAEASDAGDPGQLAGVLPITGRRARVGEPALRGLSLAAGTFSGTRTDSLRPFQLAIHDTESTVEGARAALEEVATGRSIAVVGPVDGKMVDAVAPIADSRGIPLISLNLRSGRRVREGARFIFHIQLSAEDRAEALARHAMAENVGKIAILRPKSGYGRAVGKAFRAEFEKLGGRITKDVEYEPNTTSFSSQVSQLGDGFDALFIPEQASRLALIAPALAAADLAVAPLSSLQRARERQNRRRRTQTTRPIGMLSTAEFIDATFLRNAARYCRGAVFAPGFFPDRDDPIIRDFVDRFEFAFETQPTALDAYAHDAAHLLRKTVEDGANTRAELADRLARTSLEGLTGTIAFDDKHRRSDLGLLFAVQERGGEYQIRALR